MQLRLGRNAVWAIAEVFCSGVMLFLLYKIVVKSLGVEALGIWSLVLATTSLGRLADLGTAAGLSRFVAIAHARNEKELAMHYAETAIITNFFLYLIIAFIVWLPAYYGLALATSGAALERARVLLPYSLISFIFMSLAAAATGALVGQQRSDQKSMISIAGVLVQFFVALTFISHYSLPALAWAQVAQYFIVVIASWLLFLKNHYGVWRFTIPVHWRRSVFRELIGFGIKLQAATILSFLYEPISKFIISSLGGLGALGLFEMAQRLVQQVRQLVVMPIQILVPGFAHIREQSPDQVEPLYHKAMAVTLLAGLPLMAAVAFCSPVIGYLWIGHVQHTFVLFAVIMSAAWCINLMAAPAYLLGVASGHIKWNIAGHAITTLGTPALGYLLGTLYGASGVVLATGMALACGSQLSMFMNCRTLNVGAWPKPKDFYDIKILFYSMIPNRKQNR